MGTTALQFPKQEQDKDDDQNQSHATVDVVAAAVTFGGKTSKKDENENDNQNSAKAHDDRESGLMKGILVLAKEPHILQLSIPQLGPPCLEPAAPHRHAAAHGEEVPCQPARNEGVVENSPQPSAGRHRRHAGPQTARLLELPRSHRELRASHAKQITRCDRKKSKNGHFCIYNPLIINGRVS